MDQSQLRDSVSVNPRTRAVGAAAAGRGVRGEQATSGGGDKSEIRLAWHLDPVENSAAVANKLNDCAHDPSLVECTIGDSFHLKLFLRKAHKSRVVVSTAACWPAPR